MRVLRKGLAFAGGMILGAMLLLACLFLYPFEHASRTERTMPRFLRDNPDHERFQLRLSDDLLSVATSGNPGIISNRPAGTDRLTEPNVRDGLAMIALIRDSRNRPVGFSTELEAGHEDSRLIHGRIMTHTSWTLIIPGRGALFLYQTEDNWILFKRFVLPALLWGRHWQGSWKNLNTLGPSLSGYGEIIGGTGSFKGAKGHFVEYAELRKFSLDRDFVGKLDLYIARR